MQNKICMGIWGMTNLRDRFNVNGFKHDVSVADRIRQVGSTEGIDGIELHVPTEIDDGNFKQYAELLRENKLQVVQLCGHTWTEGQYRDGALAHSDQEIRQEAIDRVKWALDMGHEFGSYMDPVPISVLWPATDGNDFPGQAKYLELHKRYRDSVHQIMSHVAANDYVTKVCVEPKPFEPRSYIMLGHTGQVLALVNDVNDPNFGINIDIGHSLIARENVEDQVAQVGLYGKLFHTHWDDNDGQADMDVPPGAVSFERMVAILYALDDIGYSGWFGLDLFPYRDDTQQFMDLSVQNLRIGKKTVELMKKAGADELRADVVGNGPTLSHLMRQCIADATQQLGYKTLHYHNRNK